VEEALLLSQRVVVLSPRPGRVVRIIEADHGFEGSRREIITSPGFVSLKQQALEALGS
jgi:ABC-type taurine transport system ATPase subunit